MSDSRPFPGWEERYRAGGIEAMPWYWPLLDRDFEAALGRYRLSSGRGLDIGAGAGTQAIALAERGFTMTGTDIASGAIEYAARNASARGISVTFVQDDILATRLDGSFDVIFNRGCFHVIEPAERAAYVDTVRRLVSPSGWLFLKTFSHLQPGEFLKPHRFTLEDLRRLFDASHGFEVAEILETDFESQLDTNPKALFAAVRPIEASTG
jgi:2-polyprenyl-3-methyl-5-hydroxy-6-metoxy-1,4-benzoquinol methylase